MANSNNWDGKNRAAAPDAAYVRGYDVDTTAMQAHDGGANAYLSDGGDNTHVKLTIVSIETDLSLSGSRGQSTLQQDFYPRNFQQPSYTITCQARSQQEIGRVAEFVHKAQRNSVARGSLMGLVVPGSGLRHTRAPASGTNHTGMKGTRKGMSIAGYVRSMPRAHKRHDPAPLYSFEFVVSRSRAGIFEDQPYKVYKLAKWSDIVDTVLSGHFIKPPKTVEQEQQEEAIQEAIDAVDFLGDILGFGD